MNAPNILTVLRIILTPFFLLFLILDFPHHLAVALIVFSVAAFTDWLDGRLARKYNLVTDFGKLFDPIADKMLTFAALLGFIYMNFGTGVIWATLIILLREFLITSFRMLAADKGTVIAANIFGKTKTVVQMISIIAAILFEYVITLSVLPVSWNTPLRITYTVLIWLSAAAALLSGVTYLTQNSKTIRSK